MDAKTLNDWAAQYMGDQGEEATFAVETEVYSQSIGAAFVVLTIAVSLGPGVGEELFFRGLMMRSLLSTGRPAAAVGISALFFGLIHFDVLQSPGAALIGAYLGVVALRANSLYPAMAAHAANNLICALFARFSDAEGPNPVLEGHPPWLLAAAAVVFAVALWGLLFTTGKPTSAESPTSTRSL